MQEKTNKTCYSIRNSVKNWVFWDDSKFGESMVRKFRRLCLHGKQACFFATWSKQSYFREMTEKWEKMATKRYFTTFGKNGHIDLGKEESGGTVK